MLAEQVQEQNEGGQWWRAVLTCYTSDSHQPPGERDREGRPEGSDRAVPRFLFLPWEALGHAPKGMRSCDREACGEGGEKDGAPAR